MYQHWQLLSTWGWHQVLLEKNRVRVTVLFECLVQRPREVLRDLAQSVDASVPGGLGGWHRPYPHLEARQSEPYSSHYTSAEQQNCGEAPEEPSRSTARVKRAERKTSG